MTVLSHPLAQDCQINLVKDSELVVGNSTNKNFNTDLGFIDLIELAGVTISHQPSLILTDDLLSIPNPKTKKVMVIDGIIGWDVIQHIVLEINYRNKRVMIDKPIPKENAENNLFFCGAPIVKAKAKNDVQLFFGLDTGAANSHFDQPLLSKIDNLEIEKRITHAGGIGEVKEVELDSIKSLTISLNENQSITLQNLRQVLAEFATFFKLDGVLGSDFARDDRLIIDYTNRSIELVK